MSFRPWPVTMIGFCVFNSMASYWWTKLPPGGASLAMPKDNRNISSNQGLGEEDDSNIWTYGLQVDYDLGFATLTSQTEYKDHEYVYAEDFDADRVSTLLVEGKELPGVKALNDK